MAIAFASERAEATVQRQPLLPWLRWGSLGLLLGAELVLLSMRFDTGTLRDVSGEWALAVAITPRLVRLAILAVAVGTVLHIRGLRDQLQSAAAGIAARSAWGRFVVLHLACLCAFVWLTREILEHGLATGRSAPVSVLAWFASGALSIAGWALAVLPAVTWRNLVIGARPGLAVGLSVGVAMWSSELVADGVWQPLARGTLWCASHLLAIVYPDVIYHPTSLIIGTSAFAVRIDPDCSGYEGMALILAFLSGYLWFERDTLRLPRAFILLPLGALASWLANVLRTALLVAIGSSWSESVAMGGFHSQAGAIAFSGIGLAFVAAARRSAWFTKPAVFQGEETANPTAAYLVPLLVVIAVGMLTSAISSSVDALYPLRVWAGLGALWYFRRCYADLFVGNPMPLASAVFPELCLAGLLGGAVFVIWVLLAPAVASAGPAAELLSWPASWRLLWWVSRVTGYLLVAPLVEELAFRGFLIRRLLATDFEEVSPQSCPWWAMGTSALAFGLLHGGFWAAGILAGLAYGYAYCLRGRLLHAVVAHAATNTLLLLYVMISGNWTLLS